MAVRFDASGDYLLRTANLPSPTAFGACGWAVLDVDRNASTCFFALESGTSSAASTIALFADTDGTSLKLFSPAGGGVTSGTLASLVVGQPFFWAVTGNGAGAGGLTAYYRAAGSNTLSSVSLFGYTFTSGALFLGNNSYAEWLNGRTWNAKVWDRVPSADELLIESFFDRPQFPAGLNLWLPMSNASDVADRSGNARNPTVGGTLSTGDSAGQLWRPKQRRLKQAASGGAVDLLTSGASHGHTAENVVLTTSATLSIDSATHAHTAGALTLATGTTLGVDSATHDHTAQPLSLTTDSTLTTASAMHAHVADAPVLTTDSTLAIASATHSHTAENLTLNTAAVIDLVIDSATHGHTAQAANLTAASVLEVDSATHAHVAGSVALTLDTTLAIAHGTHAHTADEMTLSAAGAVTLTVANAVHAHVAENIALTSASTLAVQDAQHAHIAESVVLSQTTALVIANAAHAHTAGNLVLSVIPTLVVADAVHAHTADSPALSVDAWLQVADAWHAHLADNVQLVDPSIVIEIDPLFIAKPTPRNWVARNSPRNWEAR